MRKFHNTEQLNAEPENIEAIIGEHARVRHNQRLWFNLLALLSIIVPVIYVMLWRFSDIPLPPALVPVVICAGLGYLVIWIFLPDWFVVLSRDELFRLMRFTENDEDARALLRTRLLSGELLTGRDEREIMEVWQRNEEALMEARIRKAEQNEICKFLGQEKSE